jgi:hypothetical protein
MKIKQVIVAFLFTALVISCGDKAKDIDASELKTECEVVDAQIIIMNEMVALAEVVDSEEGASDAQKKEWKSLVEKIEEIRDQFVEMKLDKDKAEDCPKFKTGKDLDKKTRKQRKVFK